MPSKSVGDIFVINPYDMFALNELIQLRSIQDISITCICMGPLSAKPAISRCLAMGADKAILISDDVFIGSDTYVTSYVLSEAIKKLGAFDLIVCGTMAIDGETGQVVYGLAERLSVPCATDITKITNLSFQSLIAKRNIQDKCQTIEVRLPAIVSYNEFFSYMPSVSLMNLKRARLMPITEWSALDLNIIAANCGQEGSKTRVLKTSNSFHQVHGISIEGDYQKMSKQLMLLINKVGNA